SPTRQSILYETVSVIIPTYSDEPGLRRAVASVLAQTVTGLEIIIVDDGSPVQVTPDRLPSDSRIRILSHVTNRGASAARNTGRRAARGAWIAHLDSDDIWRADKLQRQLDFAREAEAA